jgi:hypothetical protein
LNASRVAWACGPRAGPGFRGRRAAGMVPSGIPGISLFPFFPLFVNFFIGNEYFIYFFKKAEKAEKGKWLYKIYFILLILF